MFGGSDPGIPQVIPSDIEFRGNYIRKDPTRRTGDPRYKIKNLFELKNGRRILIEGNVFENFGAVFNPSTMPSFSRLLIRDTNALLTAAHTTRLPILHLGSTSSSTLLNS